MKTTSHGKHPLFKTTSALFTNSRGRPLVAFGWTPEHAERKVAEYLHDNKPVGKPRTQLRVIQGGKSHG